MRRRNAVHALLLIAVAACALWADKPYSLNRRARILYEQGKYDEALDVLDEAQVEAPGEHGLKANRGSTLYRLDRFDESAQSYGDALESTDPAIRADAHYNRGNALYREGEQMMAAQNQGAMDKFKEALQEYTEALKARPGDRDAKWNLQLAHARLEQMKNQQQNQQDQQNKDQDNKDDQQQQKDQQKQDQQNEDKQKKQDEQQKQDEKDKQDKQDSQDQQQKQDEQDKQKRQPQPQQQEEMKKEEAARLLKQFADDDKELNKPPRKAVAGQAQSPEKDW